MPVHPLSRVVLLPRIASGGTSLLRGHWTAADLREFLEASARHGLRLESIETLLTDPPAGAPVGLVLDRFDRGLLHHARPVLEEAGVGFTVVLESARVGQLRRTGLREREAVPPWSEVRDLVRRGGDVASGGHHGVSLRALAPEVIYGELLRSRCEIDRRVGRPPRALRYPFGEVTPEIAHVAERAGFELGLCTQGSAVVEEMQWPVLRPGRLEGPARFARRVAESSGQSPTRAAAGD